MSSIAIVILRAKRDESCLGEPLAVVSAGLPVASLNKYYAIGLVVVKTRVREFCPQCGLNAN